MRRLRELLVGDSLGWLYTWRHVTSSLHKNFWARDNHYDRKYILPAFNGRLNLRTAFAFPRNQVCCNKNWRRIKVANIHQIYQFLQNVVNNPAHYGVLLSDVPELASIGLKFRDPCCRSKQTMLLLTDESGDDAHLISSLLTHGHTHHPDSPAAQPSSPNLAPEPEPAPFRVLFWNVELEKKDPRELCALFLS